MACRRSLQQLQSLLRRAVGESVVGSSCGSLQRAAFSTLPDDLAALAARARFPARRLPPNGAADAAAGQGSPAAAQQAAAAAAQQVQMASPWMFPWERRQLQGGELRWWEKMYWGVFVFGLALILFNRLEWEKEPDQAEIERKRLLEEQRLEAARLVLAGKSVLVPWGTDDPFGGMSPQEIEEFCKSVTGGASEADPFEGLSPEEIDEYVSKHGLQSAS